MTRGHVATLTVSRGCYGGRERRAARGRQQQPARGRRVSSQAGAREGAHHDVGGGQYLRVLIEQRHAQPVVSCVRPSVHQCVSAWVAEKHPKNSPARQAWEKYKASGDDGSGKTKTSITAIIDFMRHKSPYDTTVIWLAHSDELCEQAIKSFDELYIL